MRRRKDTFVKSSSISDIQELVSIAENHKERHEDKVRVLSKKISEMDKAIFAVREDFISFLKRNNIDTNYPVLNDVQADKVVPSTVPESSQEAIPIEQALLPNIPNDTFLQTMNLLKDKYETLQDEIEEYADTLYKMRLYKANLEAKLDSVKKSIEEYSNRIVDKKEEYNLSVSNINKVRSLYSIIFDFRYLFSVLPETFTSDSYIKFQNNNLENYSTAYYELKKKIYRQVTTLSDNFEQITTDVKNITFYKDIFTKIQSYFSSNGTDTLPNKYLDAMSKKDNILDYLDILLEDLQVILENLRVCSDAIRGVKGIGNSVVDGLISSTTEIAQSSAVQKKLEQTTLEDITSSNYTVGRSVQQKINTVKDKLKKGAESLDENFIRANHKLLRKIANTIDFPVTFEYNKDVNFEDHLREKVRKMYGGNIPFSDEVEVTDRNGNKTFIKKSEVSSNGNQSKKEAQADILEKKTKNDRDILSA